MILLEFGNFAVASEYSRKDFKFHVKAAEMKEVKCLQFVSIIVIVDEALCNFIYSKHC